MSLTHLDSGLLPTLWIYQLHTESDLANGSYFEQIYNVKTKWAYTLIKLMLLSFFALTCF